MESPASFHRQIKIESLIEAHRIETSDLSVEVRQADIESGNVARDPWDISEGLSANDVQRGPETDVTACPNIPDPDDENTELSSLSVREKRELFEEAHKAEMNKTYVRKEPIAIPQRLGPDVEECQEESKILEKVDFPKADLQTLVNKFESTEETISISDAENRDCDKEEVDIPDQEMPTFDIRAIKNVFELGEQSFSFKEEKKDQEEPLSSLSETTADTSKWESPQETKGGSRQSTPLPPQKTEVETVPAEPATFSETKSITEHFSNVDESGNKVTGTRTAVKEQSGSASAQQVPFSYADAVKRKAARRTQTYDEEATETLLRNFHQTWTESETVFKSLGYTVSEETTSQVVSNQTTIFTSGSSSEVRAVCSMSEEGLSNGCSDSGQKEVP